MKKTEIALLAFTLLYHMPVFSMDSDETNSGLIRRMQCSKKKIKSDTQIYPFFLKYKETELPKDEYAPPLLNAAFQKEKDLPNVAHYQYEKLADVGAFDQPTEKQILKNSRENLCNESIKSKQPSIKAPETYQNVNSKIKFEHAQTYKIDTLNKRASEIYITTPKLNQPLETIKSSKYNNDRERIKNVANKVSFVVNEKKKKPKDYEMDDRLDKINNFYKPLEELARKAREGEASAIAEIENYPTTFKQKNLSVKVRVRPEKNNGSKRAIGLDEFFQTSETPYFLKCDAGLIDKKKPFSTLKSGRKFGFLDAQHYLRVPTSEPVYKDAEENIIGGHTGVFYKQRSPKRGGLTTGQIAAHQNRQKEIERSSSPGNASIRSMRSYLESTASKSNYRKIKSFCGYDTKDRNLAVPDDWEAFSVERLKSRDRVKCAYRIIHNSLDDRDVSSLTSYEISSLDFSNSLDEDAIVDDLADVSRILL